MRTIVMSIRWPALDDLQIWGPHHIVQLLGGSMHILIAVLAYLKELLLLLGRLFPGSLLFPAHSAQSFRALHAATAIPY